MNSKKTDIINIKKKTPELDWFDLFLDIISHWRGIIIVAVIGLLLFGIIGFCISFFSKKEDISVKDVDDISVSIEELKDKISPEEITKAEDAIRYYDLLVKNKEYISKSPLFKIDSAKAPMNKVLLRIIDDTTNSGYQISPEYLGVLNSTGLREYIAKECNIDGEVSKLIGVDECTGDIIGMHFYNTSVDEAEKMADAFIRYIMDQSELYQKSFNKHHFDIIYQSSSEIYSPTVAAYQKEAFDSSSDYEKNIEYGLKTLGVEGIYYFKLRLMEEYGDEEVIKDSGVEYYEILAKEKLLDEKKTPGEASQNVTTIEAESFVKTAIKTSAKTALLGAIVFSFIYVIIVGYQYALSSKLNDSEELSDLYGIKSFGKIYREGKHTLPLDKAISKARRRGRELVSEEVATSVIVENAVNEAKENGVKSVAIIGVGEGTPIANSVSEKLSADSVKAVILEKPMQNPEELKKLEDVDSAIVLAKPKETCYCEIWDELELLANRGIKVLGGAVI